jgi:hypothetical protein
MSEKRFTIVQSVVQTLAQKKPLSEHWDVRIGNAILGYITGGSRTKRPLILRMRIRDVVSLIQHRHGGPCCDPELGHAYAYIAINAICDIAQNPEAYALLFARDWTPMVEPSDILDLVLKNKKNQIRIKADVAAWKLRVTRAERVAARMTTIGAIDFQLHEREEKRRKKKNDASNARRLRKINNPRKPSSEPWIAEGISRRTWFRRRAKSGTETTV